MKLLSKESIAGRTTIVGKYWEWVELPDKILVLTGLSFQIALLCRTCKNVFDYKLKEFWEKTSCPCCGSKETSIRKIPAGEYKER